MGTCERGRSNTRGCSDGIFALYGGNKRKLDDKNIHSHKHVQCTHTFTINLNHEVVHSDQQTLDHSLVKEL